MNLPAEIPPLVEVSSLADFERTEAVMLSRPQVPIQTVNRFQPGVYLRTMIAPAGCMVMGHEHLDGHWNVMLRGRALVAVGGKVVELRAPCVLFSEAHTRKVAHVLEEMEWMTVHANPRNETDPEKLESFLCIKSGTWKAHAEQKEIRP